MIFDVAPASTTVGQVTIYGYQNRGSSPLPIKIRSSHRANCRLVRTPNRVGASRALIKRSTKALGSFRSTEVGKCPWPALLAVRVTGCKTDSYRTGRMLPYAWGLRLLKLGPFLFRL